MPKCQYKDSNNVNCIIDAEYKFPGEIEFTRCKEHYMKGVKCLSKRMCVDSSHGDSLKRASFNYPDQTKGIYCESHALENMINVNNKNTMCKSCNKKQPSYGMPGKKATHCSKCAEDDMVNVVSNLCKTEGCMKNATYGHIGSKATSCKPHALTDMVDVKNTKCVICVENKVQRPKQATFGIDKPTHCLEHKPESAKDMRHDTERCQDCDTRATFGITRPLYCTLHKLDGMVDLVSKMCVSCGETQAVFGVDRTELYCVRCKTLEMKNVKAKMCEGCNEHQPVFGYLGQRPTHCSSCKAPDMLDIVNPKCKSCGLFTVTKVTLCSYCNPNAHQTRKE